jgi:cytochrome c5
MRRNTPVRLLAAAVISLAFTRPLLANCTSQPAWSGTGTSYFDACGWGDAQRLDFYQRDQGSRLIPLSWLRALNRPDGTPFLPAGLEKYGYLPNPSSHSNPFAADDVSLPVGFTLSGADATAVVGMTCAACHTRELVYGSTRLRIDGGPAIVDFQSFLSDLTASVAAVLSGSQFDTFAHHVLDGAAGPATTAQIAQLRQDVQAWYSSFNAITSRALPDAAHGWGLGRLDAVSMIFDRVAGIDIALGNKGALTANIFPADAPVRYPFIWNANLQNRTQWPGVAQNGNDLFALLRNLGEVYGVFGVLRPQRLWPPLGFPLGAPIINFIGHNSAAFDNLAQLENLLKKIPSPAWPAATFGREPANTARGKAVFDTACASCHGIKHVALQPWLWQTPLKNAWTDTREWSVLDRKAADPGLLDGMIDITSLTSGHPAVIGKNTKEFTILANTVLRSVLEHALLGQSWQPAATGPVAGLEANVRSMFVGQGALTNSEVQQAVQRPEFADLRNAYTTKPPTAASAAPATETPVYEARVLNGIWSTAPYLHNGSVATLADLLRPSCTDAQAAQDAATHVDKDRQCRRVTFAIGNVYDPVNVGLAAGQPAGAPVRVTTDGSSAVALGSGNSRAGHEGHDYGTDLPAADKAALLDYLKTL